jgi:hypothetical protein
MLMIQIWFAVSIAFADSPLTSTNFWKAFVDSEPGTQTAELIEQAHESTILTLETMDFLANPEISIGAKLALINATIPRAQRLSPQFSPNAGLFRRFLESKHRIEIAYTSPQVSQNSLVWNLIYGDPGFSYPEKLSAGELAAIGYLLALDQYLNPRLALNFLAGAARKAPKSFAVRVALGLTIGNMMMDNSDMWDALNPASAKQVFGLSERDLAAMRAESKDKLPQTVRWGFVYSLFIPLIERRAEFDQDFTPAAFQAVMDYIKAFKSSYDGWSRETEKFHSDFTKFGLDSCEGYLKPRIWTAPPAS